MKKEVIIMSHDELTRAYYERLTRIQNEITRALKNGAYLTVLKLIAAHRLTVYRLTRMTREIDAAAEYICR